jgi:hypothetical protein
VSFDWFRHSRAARWFLVCGLVLFLLTAGYEGISLVRDHLAGRMLDVSELGGFVFMASIMPLLFAQAFRTRATRTMETEAEMKLVRVFEESRDERLLSLCGFWSLTLGMFVYALTSNGAWIQVIFFAFLLCLALFNLLRRPVKLSLSDAGIEASWVKAGRISWQDIRSVELKRRLGSAYVAIEIADPKKYDLKQSTLTVTSLLFSNATVTYLLHAIRGRHAISTAPSSLQSPHQGLMV